MMQPQAFLASVRDSALATLPDELAGLHSRIRYGMLQLHYGDPRIHYEVWLVRKTGLIEVGLHFEADREVNLNHAEAIALRALELRDILGPSVEVEQWSPSWTRLHLTIPLGSLDEALTSEVSATLSALVIATGDEISRLPARARSHGPLDSGERRRHWRGRARAGGTGSASR